MGNETYYQIPEKIDQLIEIIGIIPNDWRGIDGILMAPEKLYKEGAVSQNTRLIYSTPLQIVYSADVPFEQINVFDAIKEIRMKKFEINKGSMPNIITLLDGKLFSSVYFDVVSSPTPIEQAKEFIKKCFN